MAVLNSYLHFQISLGGFLKAYNLEYFEVHTRKEGVTEEGLLFPSYVTFILRDRNTKQYSEKKVLFTRCQTTNRKNAIIRSLWKKLPIEVRMKAAERAERHQKQRINAVKEGK
jgi:hypothetical protein